MFKLDRRTALTAGVLTVAGIGLAACENGGGGGASVEGEMSQGAADAPVTVVEYASVTCGHCANWHATVYPEFKRRFIDTGRVRFVFRELPTAPATVSIAGFLMARCAGPDHYFDVVDDLMTEQRAVIGNPRALLVAIGARHGLTEAEFDACMTDEAAYNAMQARIDAALASGVNGTPTFFVNGTQTNGVTLAELEAAIVAAER